MATNVTADHDKAFAEVWDLTGEQTVTINGTSGIQAILPYELSSTLDMDGEGILHDVGQTQITIAASDLPATIDEDSTVIIGSTTFRILEVSEEGTRAKTLTIETP